MKFNCDDYGSAKLAQDRMNMLKEAFDNSTLDFTFTREKVRSAWFIHCTTPENFEITSHEELRAIIRSTVIAHKKKLRDES